MRLLGPGIARLTAHMNMVRLNQGGFYEPTNKIPCSAKVVNKVKVNLKYPDVAVDQFGNIGTWTMIYNQVRDVSLTMQCLNHDCLRGLR